ncbi:ArsR/SmtB family transcription factor [Arcobacter sp.]|uniref:ArsR/SmtB family transcription factor n=1 Tax=unclassified Arcobacter TaxID=2593671 RepID=UPI003AFF6DE8
MSKYQIPKDDESINKAAKMFKALSNPYRLKIYVTLVASYKGKIIDESEEETLNCQREFANLLGLANSTTSHHFKELKEAGLIHTERKGKNVLFWVDSDSIKVMEQFFII